MARMIGSICSLIVCLIVYTTSAKTKADLTRNMGDFGLVQKLLDARANRESSSTLSVGDTTVDDVVSMLSTMCPMEVGMGITFVEVSQNPKNQINCYYEIPDSLDMSNPTVQKSARQWAIDQFDKRNLTGPTKELGVTWNYVYKRSYGAIAFSMKIRPEDLGKSKTKPADKTRSTLPTSLQQKINDIQASVRSHTQRSTSLLDSIKSQTARGSSTGGSVRSHESRRFDSKVSKNVNGGRNASGTNSGVVSNPFVGE